MAFPDTRLTVMQRLAAGGNEDDWRQFLADYWGPVFRFCLHRGIASPATAEEITAAVFESLWTQNLLRRWQANRAAKLRTLICAVARNLISQHFRAQRRQERLDGDPQSETEDADSFYAAWAEDVLRRSMNDLSATYRRDGKGNYLRVFLARTCDEMSIREVAQALELPESAVDHHYRHVRDRLQQKLSALIREQVAQYCLGDDLDDEFRSEWQRLGEYVRTHGDLELILRRSLQQLDVSQDVDSRRRGITQAVARLSTVRPTPDATP